MYITGSRKGKKMDGYDDKRYWKEIFREPDKLKSGLWEAFGKRMSEIRDEVLMREGNEEMHERYKKILGRESGK